MTANTLRTVNGVGGGGSGGLVTGDVTALINAQEYKDQKRDAAKKLLTVSPGDGVNYAVANFVDLAYASRNGVTETGDALANVAAMVMSQSWGRYKRNNKAVLEAVAANTFSSEFDTLGNAVGQAVFAGRSNKIRYSRFQGSWNTDGIAAWSTDTSKMSPLGTMDCRKISAVGSQPGGIYSYHAPGSSPAGAYVFHLSVAPGVGGNGDVQLQIFYIGGASLIDINMTTGSAGYTNGPTVIGTPYIDGSGMLRVAITASIPAAITGVAFFWPGAHADGDYHYVDCAQFESGSVATSYIHTNGAAVDVPADVISETLTGFTGEEIAFGGTFIAPPRNSAGQTVMGIYSDTPIVNYSLVYIVPDGRMEGLLVNSGSAGNTALTSSSALTPGKIYKWVMSLSKSRGKARLRVRCEDGTLFDVSQSRTPFVFVTPSKMIGNWFGGSQLNSYILEDFTYNRSLSDAEILELVP